MKKLAILSAAGLCMLASCTGGKTSEGSVSDAVERNSGIVSSPSSIKVDFPGQSVQGNLVEETVDADTPAIRFISNGSILPSAGSLDLLFSSVSYAKAEVRVQKIYSNNILQFLQYGKFEARYNLANVAREVLDTTIVLGSKDAPGIREKKVYGLSLDELVKPETGAIYHVEIRGREPLVQEDYWDSDYYFGNSETYESRHVYLLASNLALISKAGDNATEVFVCDILSGKPVQGAKVKLYDSVQQEIGKGVSDKDGRVDFAPGAETRFVTANHGKDWAYLALKNEDALTTSNFDVSGTEHEGGIKAYIFGERGVWRPGDTLHVSVITMFDGKALPEGHPVTAELRNPDGQPVQTLMARADGSNIYTFPFVTESDAPTGRWSVNVNVGGQSFSKTLRVETVKPNNLDIGIRFDSDILEPETSCVGEISANWLYGAPGGNLKLNAEMDLSAATTSFKGWNDYTFKDEARKFEGQSFRYDDMVTNDEGKCYLNCGMTLNRANIPGMLSAGFNLTAFEPSGEFSTGYDTFTFSPFKTYVGLRTHMDKTEWGDLHLKAGVPHRFDVASVDARGKGIDADNLQAEIYHVDWSWWWNASGEIASYMAGSHKELLYESKFSTKSGKGGFSYDWKDAPAGLYYIRVTDRTGGHAASLLCEVMDTGDSRNTSGATGSTKLTILQDKESYKVGETARITIPSAQGTRALVSIEKGGRILSTTWAQCYAGSTDIKIPVTADMLPNAYAFVTLVQPHSSSINDAPVRMYGVCNLNVEDGRSHLKPEIEIAAKVKPESRLSFKVREENGRAMSYVVALVDEGLLSLTGFKTPDAWKSFYAKEALRVRTWDLYDQVIGAYGGRIEQLFAVGGDEDANAIVKRKGADRFKPVVSFLGPFTLKAGKTATHSVMIPQYIGSMRAMVIATDGKAQGSCQKDVTVSKPVMVQATLPRTLSTGEHIKVPVTVMTLEDHVGKVTLSIKTDGKFKVTGEDHRTVDAGKSGQTVEYFEIEVGDATGIGNVSVTAQSAGDKSTSSISVDILNPNPEVTRAQSILLAKGQSKEMETRLFGVDGSNSLSIEFSSIPAIDLGRRLKYLLEYPYGCVEQTVSAAFPQLYLDKVMDCDEHVRTRSARNIEGAIRRLQSFRLSDGSLSYWPGTGNSSAFGTVYALHFLQEAENAGYAVPSDLKGSIAAASKVICDNSKEDQFARAYGLYALAIAGKPDRSAMNNMREKAQNLGNGSKWMLAAAFAADGKKKVACDLTASLPYADENYSCYGSLERNMAVALKTLVSTSREAEAFKLAADLAEKLNDPQYWMSTQGTAWSLYAMSSYAGSMGGGGITATVDAGGKNYKVLSDKSISSIDLPVGTKAETVKLRLANTGAKSIYAVVTSRGVPEAGSEKAQASGLRMNIQYIDENGATMKADTISRGRSFRAVVTVTNTGSAAVRDLALVQKFPSGWEIRNERIYKENAAVPAGLTWQDIRDDRVCSFFDLAAGASVTVTTRLTAAYPGKFYLPAASCEAMYDASVRAVVPGRWTEVK